MYQHLNMAKCSGVHCKLIGSGVTFFGIFHNFTALVEFSLFILSFFSFIIFLTSIIAAFFSMRLTTTKWTSKVITSYVSGMCDKSDLTVFAFCQALTKTRMIPNYRTKCPIVLRNYPSNLSFKVPTWNKFKKCLNLGYKNAKSLLVWLMKSDIPSLSFFLLERNSIKKMV